jgi:hypothetical protein
MPYLNKRNTLPCLLEGHVVFWDVCCLLISVSFLSLSIDVSIISFTFWIEYKLLATFMLFGHISIVIMLKSDCLNSA